jgi:flagellar protein FliO/FliZ
VDTFLLALRVVVSLGVVIGAIWFVQRRVSRGSGGPRAKRAGKPMSVIARQNLGPKASVAVVEFGGKRFLLGVTEHGIAVLDDTQTEAEETVAVTEAAAIEAPAAPITPVAPVAVTRRASSKQNSRDFALALGQVAADATPAAKTAVAPRAATPPVAAVRLAKPQNFTGAFPGGNTKMAGSILSAATWKQAWIAVRGRN